MPVAELAPSLRSFAAEAGERSIYRDNRAPPIKELVYLERAMRGG